MPRLPSTADTHRTCRRLLCALGLALSAVLAAAAPLPQHLRDTGLYASGSSTELQSEVVPFVPQHTLWSDEAEKRRWIRLPKGRSIDASQADAWAFPAGTRLWKEFSQGGRRIETRFIERLADGRWRFASYVWDESGTEAVLAPEAGLIARGGHEIPSRADCVACHGGAPVPVLGFSAVQLAPDLPRLVAQGLLRRLPAALLAPPPPSAAATPTERATLGYLHANCAHCHNHNGTPVPLPLSFAQTALDGETSRQRVLRSLIDVVSRYRLPGDGGAARGARIVAPGQPEQSLLLLRMRSRQGAVQMPPLGTRQVDADGLALVERWISELPPPTAAAPAGLGGLSATPR